MYHTKINICVKKAYSSFSLKIVKYKTKAPHYIHIHFLNSISTSQSLFTLVLVSSSCSFWTPRLSEEEILCSLHLSLCPACPSSCQGQQESPLQGRASLDRTLCSASQRCRSGCRPSAGGGSQRSLEVPWGGGARVLSTRTTNYFTYMLCIILHSICGHVIKVSHYFVKRRDEIGPLGLTFYFNMYQ